MRYIKLYSAEQTNYLQIGAIFYFTPLKKVLQVKGTRYLHNKCASCGLCKTIYCKAAVCNVLERIDGNPAYYPGVKE